jgi:hypothetical protein
MSVPMTMTNSAQDDRSRMDLTWSRLLRPRAAGRASGTLVPPLKAVVRRGLA